MSAEHRMNPFYGLIVTTTLILPGCSQIASAIGESRPHVEELNPIESCNLVSKIIYKQSENPVSNTLFGVTNQTDEMLVLHVENVLIDQQTEFSTVLPSHYDLNYALTRGLYRVTAYSLYNPDPKFISKIEIGLTTESVAITYQLSCTDNGLENL